MQDEADDAANTAEDKAAIEMLPSRQYSIIMTAASGSRTTRRIQPAQAQMQTAKYTLANLPTWVRINNMDLPQAISSVWKISAAIIWRHSIVWELTALRTATSDWTARI